MSEAQTSDDEAVTEVNGETYWTPAIRELFAQDDRERLQPGQEGWWPVWGARASDIRPGDIVMLGWRADDGTHGVDTYEVATRRSFGDRRDDWRPGFTDPEGRTFSVGAIQPIKLFCKGTRNTLADSI